VILSGGHIQRYLILVLELMRLFCMILLIYCYASSQYASKHLTFSIDGDD
jgi:hypothetical protein